MASMLMLMPVSLVMNYVLAGGLVWLIGTVGVVVWVLRAVRSEERITESWP